VVGSADRNSLAGCVANCGLASFVNYTLKGMIKK